ncbi:MAG: hypothetical protein M1831_005990 [Alyxoria varia]|nr:MAG: hypothetical protein M1831_005990 [Alyxoria varia]
MEGAASLIRNRGDANFTDQASRSIYRAIRSQLVSHASFKHVSWEVPDPAQTCRYTQAGKELDQLFTRKDLNYDDQQHQSAIHDRIHNIAVEVNRLRARSQRLKTSSVINDWDILELLAWAEKIEDDLVNWETEMLETSLEDPVNRKFHNGLWRSRVVPAYFQGGPDVELCELDDEYLEDTPLWPGIQYLQIYDNPVEAANCNHFRTFQIFVHAVILFWSSWLGRFGDAIDSDRFDRSLRMVQELVDGVCASIPPLLGYQLDHQRNRDAESPTGQTPAAIARSSIMAIHPLYTILCVETIPQKQRTWIAGRLRAIARERGWKQADILSRAEPSVISSGTPFGGIFGMWDSETYRQMQRRQAELKQTWPFK